jgi:hypothetical protein
MSDCLSDYMSDYMFDYMFWIKLEALSRNIPMRFFDTALRATVPADNSSCW